MIGRNSYIRYCPPAEGVELCEHGRGVNDERRRVGHVAVLPTIWVESQSNRVAITHTCGNYEQHGRRY